MDIKTLQREAHETAKALGWYDTEPSFGDFTAGIQSELSQAYEAHREREFTAWASLQGGWPPDAPWKPCGVVSALADVVIRVADMAEFYGVNLEAEIAGVSEGHHLVLSWVKTFGDWVSQCSLHLCDALRHQLSQWNWEFRMAELIATVQLMAAHYDLDLASAIETKMDYYRATRPNTEARHDGN